MMCMHVHVCVCVWCVCGVCVGGLCVVHMCLWCGVCCVCGVCVHVHAFRLQLYSILKSDLSGMWLLLPIDTTYHGFCCVRGLFMYVKIGLP